MRIFLIGFMGSGKSHIGKRLAPKMDFAFLDLDDFIEQRASSKISALFKKFGESHFRKLEKESLQATASFHRFIIGAGGGTPCYFDNMEWMNNNGLTIYLKTPEDILFERLTRKRAHRPLVASLSDRELRSYIQNKIEEREPYYMQAQMIYERFEDKEDVVGNLVNYFGLRFK